MLNDAKKIKNKRFEGDACKNLGLAYHSLGEFKKAMELHQLGLRIAKDTGNKDAEGQGYNNLGLIILSVNSTKQLSVMSWV